MPFSLLALPLRFVSRVPYCSSASIDRWNLPNNHPAGVPRSAPMTRHSPRRLVGASQRMMASN